MACTDRLQTQLTLQRTSLLSIVAESTVFSPSETDLELWLTFHPSALSNDPNDSYPVNSPFSAATPMYVLDRSGRNRTAARKGNATFSMSDTGSMSTMSLAGQGMLTVPGLTSFVWQDGFTATAFFKRTGGDRYQSVMGNGLTPYSSLEFRLAPDDFITDNLLCFVSIEVNENCFHWHDSRHS